MSPPKGGSSVSAGSFLLSAAAVPSAHPCALFRPRPAYRPPHQSPHPPAHRILRLRRGSPVRIWSALRRCHCHSVPILYCAAPYERPFQGPLLFSLSLPLQIACPIGYLAQAFFNISVIDVAPYFWLLCGLMAPMPDREFSRSRKGKPSCAKGKKVV